MNGDMPTPVTNPANTGYGVNLMTRPNPLRPKTICQSPVSSTMIGNAINAAWMSPCTPATMEAAMLA